MSANGQQKPLPTNNVTCRPSIGSTLQNERGVAAVLAGILILFLVAFSAFAVDLGFAWVTQNELQNIADAGALAATRQLGDIYAGLTLDEQKDKNRTLTGDERTRIMNMASNVGQLNKAGGQSGITIDVANDVEIGTWSFANKTLTPTFIRPTAVTVTARRDNAVNGPIGTFFANVMGFTEMNVSATATAALGPVGSVNPGESNIPVGISERWFQEGHACGDSIMFHPTGTLDGCAGWHVYGDGPSSASTLRQILDGLADGSYESPGMTAGDQLEYTGGNLASVFPNMKNLYDTHKNPDTGEWDVKIPVYDRDDCSNPNQSIAVVGFVTAKVTQVIEAPEQQIMAQVTCDMIVDGRTGGGLVDSVFSPLSTIPALVN